MTDDTLPLHNVQHVWKTFQKTKHLTLFLVKYCVFGFDLGSQIV